MAKLMRRSLLKGGQASAGISPFVPFRFPARGNEADRRSIGESAFYEMTNGYAMFSSFSRSAAFEKRN
jgi:hypothetical protein